MGEVYSESGTPPPAGLRPRRPVLTPGPAPGGWAPGGPQPPVQLVLHIAPRVYGPAAVAPTRRHGPAGPARARARYGVRQQLDNLVHVGARPRLVFAVVFELAVPVCGSWPRCAGGWMHALASGPLSELKRKLTGGGNARNLTTMSPHVQ